MAVDIVPIRQYNERQYLISLKMHLDLIIEGLPSAVKPQEQASRPNRMTTLPKPFVLVK